MNQHHEGVTKAVEKFSKKAENPEFKRKGRVGLNILRLEIGETRYLEVLEVTMVETKKYGELDAANVTDLETGEQFTLWLDGALKHNFSHLSMPAKIELQKLPKVEATVMIDGKPTEKEVNQYEMFLID